MFEFDTGPFVGSDVAKICHMTPLLLRKIVQTSGLDPDTFDKAPVNLGVALSVWVADFLSNRKSLNSAASTEAAVEVCPYVKKHGDNLVDCIANRQPLEGARLVIGDNRYIAVTGNYAYFDTLEGRWVKQLPKPLFEQRIYDLNQLCGSMVKKISDLKVGQDARQPV
jgi:hypothetical protein